MTINKPIFSHNMALYQSILENAAWNTQFLLDNDLFDEKTFGPKIDEIEKTIIPHYYEHPQEELPSIINECVRRAYQAGAACEALGDSQGASAWYRTGRHAYRSGWLAGENFALSQEPAAICAALAGNDNRAPDLFTYMAQNYSLSFAEAALAYYEETRQYQAIWQPLGFWIFSLSWLGDWQEVLRLAEIGREAIEKNKTSRTSQRFSRTATLD